MSAILGCFLFLYLDAVSGRIGVLTYASNLPGNPAASLAAGYFEAVARDFFRDVKVRPRCPNRRQLIAEIAVQCLEIVWQVYCRFPLESSMAIPL